MALSRRPGVCWFSWSWIKQTGSPNTVDGCDIHFAALGSHGNPVFVGICRGIGEKKKCLKWCRGFRNHPQYFPSPGGFEHRWPKPVPSGKALTVDSEASLPGFPVKSSCKPSNDHQDREVVLPSAFRQAKSCSQGLSHERFPLVAYKTWHVFEASLGPVCICSMFPGTHLTVEVRRSEGWPGVEGAVRARHSSCRKGYGSGSTPGLCGFRPSAFSYHSSRQPEGTEDQV